MALLLNFLWLKLIQQLTAYEWMTSHKYLITFSPGPDVKVKQALEVLESWYSFEDPAELGHFPCALNGFCDEWQVVSLKSV